MNLIKGIRRILIILWLAWTIMIFLFLVFIAPKDPTILDFIRMMFLFQIPPLIIYFATMWILKGFVKDK